MTDAIAHGAIADAHHDVAGSPALAAILRWPSDRPLAALVSASGSGPWSRRSILAEPKEIREVRLPGGLSHADSRRAIERELRGLLRRRVVGSPSPHTGWIASLSYDLGRVFEPKAEGPTNARATDDRDWPLATFAWCPDALVIDHATGAAEFVGDPAGVPLQLSDIAAPIATDDLSVGAVEPHATRDAFEATVARCVRLIHEGDLFQANIARRMSAVVRGSTRTLATRALAASGAWFGAYLECGGGRTIVSMSPELFLSLDGSSRRVVTRPIKGTRPADRGRDELEASGKDQAELAMIVDLMRNDLGRVARIGSVAVDSPRAIESHPTVHHAVAEVSGVLRDDVDAVALLAATFPPGSVTGAPKVRAMQVIDELEPRRRGPYCGATGLFASDGSIALNVAIRTIAASGRGHPRRCAEIDGILDYWAGCGIVAESDPAAEWDESVAKTEVLLRALAV